jgi:hypothetical protein
MRDPKWADVPTDINQSQTLSLFGMSMTNTIPIHGSDGETQGHVFFTRPALRLDDANIRGVREFASLLNSKPASVSRWARCTLDPWLMDRIVANTLGKEVLTCPLVNNTQAFIPALSNLCTSISGWPSRAVSTYVSKPGKHREVYMQVDGRSRKEGPVDMTLEFARLPGDPVSRLLELWGIYPEYIHEGYMYPYVSSILSWEIDYNFKFYRFSTDITGRYIQKYGTVIPGIIQVSGQGSDMDYNRSNPRKEIPNTVSFPVKFPAVEQNDPAILDDFNRTVLSFKPYMGGKYRDSTMRYVPIKWRKYFKGYMYPWVDLNTSELQSWADIRIALHIEKALVERGLMEDGYFNQVTKEISK